MQISCDLHIHTPLSKCCTDPRQSPPSVIAHLTELGLKRIAFTDHVWMNPEHAPGLWYASNNGRAVLALKEGIRNSEFPIEVLVGCEADMCTPDCFGINMEQRQYFDLVLLASNHFQLRDFVRQPYAGGGAIALTDLMIEFFSSAALSGLADILVHPLMPLGYMEHAESVHRCIGDDELFDLLSLAAASGSAIEINAAVLHCWYRSGFSEELLLRLFETAKQAGCRFTFGSDAHNQDNFIERYRLLGEFVKKLQLTPDDLSPWITSELAAY